MSWASKTHTFSPSTVAKSSEVNANFDDMVDQLDIAMPSDTNGHGIIMWSGSVATIPSGWYLCNGANGTPDLRGRFILGAGGSYNPGDTGGEATHVLTIAEMPAHDHGGGNHRHSLGLATNGDQDGSGSNGAIYGSGMYTDYSGAIISSQGSGSAHNNMPPYYALAFIMKS